MQEVFEKIIEKQEELFQDLSVIEVLSHVDFDSTIQNSLENFLKAITNEAIEIVKQEAEQYQSSEIGFISKTEVLTLIEEIKCNDDIPKNYGTLLDIMRMIRNMPTVDNTDNGWIPCSERLPEDDKKKYMVQTTNGFIDILGFTKDAYKLDRYDFAEYRGKKKQLFYDYDTEYGYIECECEVWKTLPQPYQPKGEIDE